MGIEMQSNVDKFVGVIVLPLLRPAPVSKRFE